MVVAAEDEPRVAAAIARGNYDRFLVLGDVYPGVEAWIRRVDEHPRA